MNDTQASVIPKKIEDIVKEKRDELLKVHASMAVYMMKEVSRDKKAKIRILQDKLEYRTFEYESQLLTEKINIYKDVLSVLKSR